MSEKLIPVITWIEETDDKKYSLNIVFSSNHKYKIFDTLEAALEGEVLLSKEIEKLQGYQERIEIDLSHRNAN